MSTTSPVTSFDEAVSALCWSCASASGETAKAAMNVAATAIFIILVLVFMELNITKCEPLSALVNQLAAVHQTAGDRIDSIGHTFFDQLRKLIKKISGVMRSRCSFRMILHTEDR